MKKNNVLIHLTLILTVMLSTVALLAPSVSANPKCGGVDTSIDYGCKEGTTDSISQLMLYAINFLAVGVGIAVVGGIAWGGWIYASANGDAGKAKEGRMIVINAVIGLVLFMTLWAAVNFLVPGGLFG